MSEYRNVMGQEEDVTALDAPTRLAALRATNLLDSKAERAFDRITDLARRLLVSPVALVSLVTNDRQFFKSSSGLAEPWASKRQTPLTHSFCQHVVTGDAQLCIRDARHTPLVANNQAITDLDVVAYLGMPLHTPDGATIGALCVIDSQPRQWTEQQIETLRDLTAIVEGEIALRIHLIERTEAEQALRASEISFRNTFENAAVGMAHVGLDGTWLRGNQQLSAILGYSATELSQLTFQQISHPDDLAADLQDMQQVLAGKKEWYRIEKRYFHKDGSIIWAHLTVSLQRNADGTPHYFISVIEDISARKMAEARLQLLAKASTILASSIEFTGNLQRVAELVVETESFADWCVADLLITENDTTLLRPTALAHKDDEAFAKLVNLRPQRVSDLHPAGGRSRVLQTGLPLLIPHFTADHLRNATPSQAHHFLLRHAVGTAVIAPLKIRGEMVGVFTLARTQATRPYEEADLHVAEELADRIALTIDNQRLYRDARHAEAELRTLNETLEQQVAERTQQLQQRNQELDDFTYVASHDLRSPLRAIDNLATWITEDVGEQLPAPNKVHLAKLRDRVARMDRLLTDLLAYARADRLAGDIVSVDTHALVENIGALVLPPDFSLQIPKRLPILYTIPVPLETVLRNLIANAVKHHHRSNGTVIVTAEDHPEHVLFCVIDDGPGIAPLYHERIFEIYKTLQPRDKVEGSGIGLSIVKKVVESQSGTITVESAVDQGATFRFTWLKEQKQSKDKQHPKAVTKAVTTVENEENEE